MFVPPALLVLPVAAALLRLGLARPLADLSQDAARPLGPPSRAPVGLRGSDDRGLRRGRRGPVGSPPDNPVAQVALAAGGAAAVSDENWPFSSTRARSNGIGRRHPGARSDGRSSVRGQPAGKRRVGRHREGQLKAPRPGHAPSTTSSIARAASACRRSNVTTTRGRGSRSAAARWIASSVRTS